MHWSKQTFLLTECILCCQGGVPVDGVIMHHASCNYFAEAMANTLQCIEYLH